MITPMLFPGPRDGLDEGSLAELAQDSYAIEVPVERHRTWATSPYNPIDVPDDAPALIDGFAPYGS